MAMLSTTTSSSAIPTGIRSPDIIGPSYSKNVHRTGIVLGNTNGSVIDSYGTYTPVMSTDIHVSFVTFNGEVGGRANGDLISRSYGKSPNTYYSNNVWIVYSGGYVSHEDNFNVRISYGVDIAEHT